MISFKRQIHKQFTNLSKADLHIHSNFSDGRPSIEEILDYVQNETDLNVIAITDHDVVDGALYAKELTEKNKYRFDVIVGEEVSSNEGHILALFIHKRIAPNQPAHEVLKQIHNQGGLAIAAHPLYVPRMNNRSQIWAKGVGGVTLINEKNHFEAIETVNATPTFEEENLRAKYLNRLLLFCSETGSSDAHVLDAIGKGYTLFEGKTASDLKDALLDHQTQAMNDKWDLLGLFRYGFFFLPHGLRIFINTVIFGPRKKEPEIIKFPSKHKLKKEVTGGALEAEIDEEAAEV